MHNTKVYAILEYFDKIEHNRIQKYLESPYFNKNQQLIHLYLLLRKNIFARHAKVLKKEKVWQKVYPGEAYDDTRFRKLCSDLLKLVEGFLAQQQYEENPLHTATYLMEAVGKRKMEKLYNSTLRTVRRLSDQQPYKSASYYYYQFQIERLNFQLTEQQFKRDIRTNFEELIKHLDGFYLAEKLRYYCDILNQQTLVSHEYKLLFIDEIIEHLKEHDYTNIPPIAIYFQTLLTLKEFDKEEHYFKLKKLIQKNLDDFPPDEADNIFRNALNYCTAKLNRGKTQFVKEFVDLFKDGLKSGVVLARGELSPWHFRNVVTLALRLGEYEWVESFIHNYNQYLPDDLRENSVTFNLATLYFYQKKYDKVISLLQEVEYEDLSYNLVSKTILLATYYELDEFEPLHSLLDSFRAYLNRQKQLPPQRKLLYQNLIRFLKRLANILPGDKEALSRLKTEVSKTKGIASEQWLKEKIEELI